LGPPTNPNWGQGNLGGGPFSQGQVFQGFSIGQPPTPIKLKRAIFLSHIPNPFHFFGWVPARFPHFPFPTPQKNLSFLGAQGGQVFLKKPPWFPGFSKGGAFGAILAFTGQIGGGPRFNSFKPCPNPPKPNWGGVWGNFYPRNTFGAHLWLEAPPEKNPQEGPRGKNPRKTLSGPSFFPATFPWHTGIRGPTFSKAKPAQMGGFFNNQNLWGGPWHYFISFGLATRPRGLSPKISQGPSFNNFLGAIFQFPRANLGGPFHTFNSGQTRAKFQSQTPTPPCQKGIAKGRKLEQGLS